MFVVRRLAAGLCEVQVSRGDPTANELPPQERRQLIRLLDDMIAINIWLTTLLAGNSYSPNTVYEYARVLCYALNWLAQEPVRLSTSQSVPHSLCLLTRTDLRALDAYLSIPARDIAARRALVQHGQFPASHTRKSIAPATRNMRLSALTSFYDWLVYEYEPENPAMPLPQSNPLRRQERTQTHWQAAAQPDKLMPRRFSTALPPASTFRRRKPHRRTPVALSPEELRFVFDAIPHVSHGYNAATRNTALMHLLLWGMLRKSESVSLCWEDVNDDILLVHGKGDKSRSVPVVSEDAWRYIHTYTQELRIPLREKFHGPILRQLDHEDRAITQHTVEHLFLQLTTYWQTCAEQERLVGHHTIANRYRRLADKLHPHCLRATGATLMAAAGMPLVQLALLLGHEDPATTQRYYVDAEQLALPEAVRSIFQKVQQRLTNASPHMWYHPPANTTDGGRNTPHHASSHTSKSAKAAFIQSFDSIGETHWYYDKRLGQQNSDASTKESVPEIPTLDTSIVSE